MDVGPRIVHIEKSVLNRSVCIVSWEDNLCQTGLDGRVLGAPRVGFTRGVFRPVGLQPEASLVPFQPNRVRGLLFPYGRKTLRGDRRDSVETVGTALVHRVDGDQSTLSFLIERETAP